MAAPFSSSGTVGTEFPPDDATAELAFLPPFLFWARSTAVLSAADDEAGMTCKRAAAAADLYKLFTQGQGKQKSTHTHAVNMSS